jgi:hypothetical protein
MDASWTKARVIGREFVVTRCHTSTLLDPIEELLDQVATAIFGRSRMSAECLLSRAKRTRFARREPFRF